MQEVLEFTLGGVATGMIYAAVALSLVLIWRGTRVLNYSQGGMAMFTTYVAWTVISRTGSYWAGFGVALGVSPDDVFTAVAVIAAAAILAAVFRYTAVGLRLRATAFSPGVARLLGVRIGRVMTLGWALAGLFGALAGVLVTPQTFLYPNSMDSIFVLGFTAAVIGGLESPLGAVIGGIVLGVALSFAGGYLGSELVPLYGLAVLTLVLMVRPAGLFGGSVARRV